MVRAERSGEEVVWARLSVRGSWVMRALQIMTRGLGCVMRVMRNQGWEVCIIKSGPFLVFWGYLLLCGW